MYSKEGAKVNKEREIRATLAKLFLNISVEVWYERRLCVLTRHSLLSEVLAALLVISSSLVE